MINRTKSYLKSSDEPYGTFQLKGYKKFLHDLSSRLPNTKFAFRIALVLRKLVLQNKLEIVDAISIEGLKMRLFPLDNIGDRIALFMPWFFDHREIGSLKETLKKGDVFLDIGANTGFYSILASKLVGEEGKVISFEPNPIMFKRYTFNLACNDVSNVSTFDYGLADKEGSFKLNLDPGNLGGASIIHSYEQHGNQSVEVKCRTLVDVLDEQSIDHINFMKIDVEGAEPLVLNPFFENADKSLWPQIIQIETTEGIPLEDLGYKLQLKTKSNSVFRLG